MGVRSHYPKMSEVVLGSRRRELKHLSTSRKRNQARDTPSSGERNGYSLNLWSLLQRGCGTTTWDQFFKQNGLGRPAKVGESPVDEMCFGSRSIPSTTGSEDPCGNPGAPSSKAKYEHVTDSA